MRKRLWFRTLTILLAATTLLSSTSAYNLLVYANQEMDSSTLSANVTDENYEPNITVQGGELIVETTAEDDPVTETFSWGTDANGNAADGSSQNPYQISSVEHLLRVNEIVNDSTGENVTNPNNKYFILTADIDISSLKVTDFIEATGNAYLVSTDHKNPESGQVYINIDGSYIDSYGQPQRHKITGGTSGWNIEIPGHQNFSLFGYLSENSVVSNIIFENINVNITTASPRQIALIANKNDGVIENCSINGCSVASSLTSNHNNSYYLVDNKYFYNGVAAAVADNAGTVRGVTVNDIAITVKGEDDYIGAVVAQNRGLVADTTVSGVQINATVNNYYIGGIAGYNEPDDASLGIQNCAVDMGGTKRTVKNFTRGAYVGGLVGSNDGYLYNSSVTGTFKSSDSTTVASYNMLGNVSYASQGITYYGGAAGISTGRIVNVTVADVGFYFSATTAMRRAYFGGITSTVTASESIVNCVSTGTFSAAEGTDVYSGGVIAYAPSNIADGAIRNTYTLFRLNNPTKDYIGAVIGWGGKASTLSGCYWSDQVSGCATSYIQTDAYYTDLVASADALTGNLYSANKAVIAGRNLTVTVSANELVNSWNGTGVTFSTPVSDITVPTNVANNTLAQAPYSVDITFPDGIGSSDKKSMSVAFNIDVLVTTATGDPDNINDPMIISTSAQTKFLYLVPYGHFKLSQRVSVESESWQAPIFSGTLDGNGKTITVGGPLFDAVIGNRTGDIGSALNTSDYSTDPVNDNNDYLKQGYIRNLTVDLYDNITTSVFGNLINATFVDVNLTDGDVSSDDGDADTFDGFTATLSDKRNASFAAAANGYTYIYGCSSNVSTYIEDDAQGNSYNDLAILIGKLCGNVTVDNCYINANVYIKGGISSNTGRAAFLGNISENKGYILNSAICTDIVYIATGVSGSHCAVVFGKMDNGNNYGKYKNIVWSKNNPNQVLYPSAYTFDNTQIHLWGGTATSGGSYSYPEKTVAPGVQASFTVAIPQNIKAFAGTTANDFSVSADDGDESAFTIQSVELDGTNLKFVVKAKDDAAINSKDYIRVFHQPSGLTTFVRLVVREAGLVYNPEDGYYHVASASDIKFISENHNVSDPNVSGRTYGQAAYYLDADIDMTGVTITPIGNSAVPFSGVFTGPVNSDGIPLYTISNLNIETTADNAGLFGAVDFSGADMVIGANSDTVRRGISNIAITAATVKGNSNTAVLVGYAADPDLGLNASQRDDIYGDVYINNIIISDSKIYSGTNTDTASGKSAAAVLAYAECVNLDISNIKVYGVEVMTYHYPTNPTYFVARRESSNYSAGIGGVVGTINEYYRGYGVSETMTVNVNGIDVSGVTLSGVNITGEKTYAPANAGGVVGYFFTQYTTDTTKYAKLNINNAKVSDTVIMTSGNVGGVLGASNVITNISDAHVYGSKKAAGAEDAETLPMRILGKTDYFVGGIAGYIGVKVRDDNNARDGASVTNVYGSVTNSKVENADVRAVIDAGDLANQRTRNVTAGGVVGAINGNIDANAVSGCTVTGSHVEGIIVGGVVGSGIDAIDGTDGLVDYSPDGYVAANSIKIDGCSVLGSEITTINGCIPVAEEYDLWMAYGVGGILGTNRRNLWSYATYTTVQRCEVDVNTTITNTIASPAHAATGGILGAGYENGIVAGALEIKYNEVYATIISENNVPADTAVPDATGDFYVTLSATGGLVGALIGNQYSSYEPENYEVCDLSKISVQHSVFGGSIIGTDGIGGAIGVISAASAYDTADIPSNLLSDIAITGSLASTLDNSTILRGGIAIGHIPVKTNGTAASDEDDHYAFDVAAGTDITGAFNKIYFTSFDIDKTKWPVFGYHNAVVSTTTSANYSPLAANALAMFNDCYEDVNTEDDNSTLQFSYAESATIYTLPAEQYPAETRPAGVAGAYSVAGQVWKGSNADIAKITSTGPSDLSIEPLNSGTLRVSINYVGTVGDSNWSTEVKLPAGFEFKSNNQAPLDYVEVGGETYYLVTNPYDLGIVGKNMTEGAANQGSFDAEHLALNYWIASDIELPASMFVTDGFFDGGFTPIGTDSLPFTGTFESMPAGTYTSAGGTEYVSGGNMTIRGLQFADGVHMGLFDTAQGATFRNFTLENVTATCTKASSGTSNIAYIGAVAATVKDYVTAEGITLKALNLTGANHTAGLFGGILPGASTSTAQSYIKNCSVVGDTSDDVYSNVITGRYGAAGIVSHTNHNSTNMSGITVADAAITQEYTGTDNAYFDYGAAGISLAFSGVIEAEGENRNKIIGCSITGEVASGVVTRTYTSSSKTAFTMYVGRTVSATTPTARAAIVSINNVDVIGTKVTGTHTTNAVGTTAHNYSASGGILARVDAGVIEHIITDCTLDSGTHIKALYGAGGIVGCFESPSSSATTVAFRLSVKSCETYATVEITQSTVAAPTTTTYSNRTCVGAGAILGYIPRWILSYYTTISDCTAGGIVRGAGNIGGIVGANWSTNTNTTYAVDDRPDHFAENCVISAKFETSEGVSAFAADTKWAGIIVGHAATSFYVSTNSACLIDGSFTSANYPFYNIYFSDSVYRDAFVRLYGITNSPNNYSLNTYAYYTDYVYNLNRTGTYTIQNNAAGTANSSAGGTSYVTYTDDTYRISVKGNLDSEKYIYKLNYSYVQGGDYVFDTSDFAFDTSVIGSDQFYFNPEASINGFTVTADTTKGAVTAEGSETTEFVLESISCLDSRVTVTPNGDGQYLLTTVPLTGGVSSQLYFNYSNGLTLTVGIEIEIKPEDYWFRENASDSSVNDLLIFNAANLSYVKGMAGTKSVITQCYDVYWTVSDSSVIAAANAATAGKTLGDVYTDDFIDDLATYMHPNPAYDGTEATERYITFDEMFSTSDTASRRAILLTELVGDIGNTSFEAYGEDCGPAIYSRSDAFQGTYQVLEAFVASGITQVNETYKIYGLDLRADTTALVNKTHAGMFNKIGSGAVISGISFVNPQITAVTQGTKESHVGVLAGEIEGAALENISVTAANGDRAYVVSMRTVNCIGTNAGAVAGKISGSTLTDVNISGVDVVGAATPGTTPSDATIRNVFVGGVAGSFGGTLTDVKVTDANVLVNRNEGVHKNYIAYAGGVAGETTGNSTIIGAEISALISGCDAEVVLEDGLLKTIYAVNAFSEAGDRLGGIVGLANDNLEVNGAKLTSLIINAYDVAGGIIAEVANGAGTVSVIGCDIGTDTAQASVTINGATSTSGAANKRPFYNAAGGVVGYVDNVNSLTITDCDVFGKIGQQSLEHKNCTAGGIIGLVGENLASLNSIVITTSTVQGEIAGYRRRADSNASGAALRILGAAGGIIGKIYNFATKTFDSTDTMISKSIVSAKIDLYTSVSGTTVKADFATLENQSDTNVGKIIGEVRNDGTQMNFAKAAGSALDNNVEFTDYVSDVYFSSYPQNIVAYGCNTFYINQFNDAADTYIDINFENRYMSADAESPEDISSFRVDSTIADPAVDPSVTPGGDNPYNSGTYSDVAIITFDDDSSQSGTTSSRYYSLAYDNISLDDSVDKVIKFEEQFDISVEDDGTDLSGVTVSTNFYDGTAPGLTETVEGTSHSYSYYPGVITVASNQNVDIVGHISAKYSYGLEVGIQFVSMEIAGNGSASNPFQVEKPKHFKVVRALRGAYYNQVANIDFAAADNNQYSPATEGALFADGKGIDPIGTSSAPFTGVYNGQGYVLSNVYISRADEDNVGFFGYIGTGNTAATLKNIHIELASELSFMDENSNITTVVGGITGKDRVGGLVGYANNAVITNCSVADGFVIGRYSVGGLAGRANIAQLDSCFTSTATYSSDTENTLASTKNVGALIGLVSSTTSIVNSFTLGLASVGTTNTNGVAGGFVGYVSSGTLNIADSLVAATVSEYNGGTGNRGLTVGQSAGIANVVADGVTVASTNALVISNNSVVNPILTGGATVTDIAVDTDLVGSPNGSEEYTKATKTDGRYDFSVSTAADVAGDAYTSAYVALAVIPVEVDPNEVNDKLNNVNKYAGYMYPLTVGHGDEYTFSSSILDLSDTVEYPAGLDADMYGVVTPEGVNKNTDLLFRDKDGATTVYPNIYVNQTGAVLNNGTVHSNGEVAYSTKMPYFDMTKSVSVGDISVDVTRKVYYPVVGSKVDGVNTFYAVATARQLFALSNSREAVKGSKFYDFYILNGEGTSYARDYILVADIDMSGENFVPVSGFEGTFDGNGYTADKLTINMPSYNEIGLFRSLENAEIRNLTVGVKDVVGKDNVGALVGAVVTSNVSNKSDSATVKIENCHAVQSEGGSGIVATGSNVGGLIGAATRSKSGYGINDSSASVTVSGYNVVGGLVGYCEQPVTNSYSTGDVNAEFRPSSDATQVHPWIINGTQAIAGAPLASSGEYGVGGVVGVLYNDSEANGAEQAAIIYCFGSGIITVNEAAYNAKDSVYGVGGLAGITYSGTEVSTSFSSGNVYYCYGNSTFASCANNTVGVGGLVGVNYNDLQDVYSGASVAADFGDVTNADAVGAGGVIGVAYGKLSDAYSSGATLGTTTTTDYSDAKYGAGGVIGLLDSGVQSANLLFDLNISITDKVVGKILSGSIDSNSQAHSTEYLTAGNRNLINYQFGYTKGAYPYLNAFFKNDVSLVIRTNALLSVVALQLNPLDTLAANGEGISMALNIPVDFEYVSSGGGDDTENVGLYKYGYADENDMVDAAQGVIDSVTNTLSIQRTQNEAQYVNFVISIESKNGEKVDKDGNVYSQVANRLVSRLCAPMLGTETHPYLVATQEDLSHVGMTNDELTALNASDPDSMYRQWATPILENGTPTSGTVKFKLMGYVPLDGYNRTIADLTSQVYNVEGQSIAYEGIYFDGNGYSIRNLTDKLFVKLDSKSTLRNMTFENVSFADESLIGELDGMVEGVNVYGAASGIGSAAIARTVGSTGKIIGAVANIDYNDSTSTNDVAGIAVTNNGTIEMSASVGNFTGSAVSGMGGLVVNNNGTIRNSFTIGNLTFGDANNLGGFVNNNAGTIENCYTRCNIMVSNTAPDRVIGGFAAHNSGSIASSYSSGIFDLSTNTNPLNIFASDSTGTLEHCMFDKQMSGSTFSNIYDLAERTIDIVKLTNHAEMKPAYTVSEDMVIDESNEIYHNVYYPQLAVILATEDYETVDDEQVETVDSRMYRVLRAYSFISSATALVGNDNYIDNLALGSSTPLSYDAVNRDLWRRTSGSELASATIIGESGSVNGRKILAVDTLPGDYDAAADNRSVISATTAVTDFYGLTLADNAQLDLFVEVTGLGHPNFAGGKGTAEAPFEISTPEQFVALSFFGTNAANSFVVINDIDMGEAVWTAYIDNFKATLDGNGKAVSNVTIGADGNDSLFGTINGGKIDGLGVAGIDVTVDGSSGGMLASTATGGASITNSYVVGTLTTTDTAQTNVGGIVGEIDAATIDGCVVSGKIVSDASATGGVVASALDGSVISNVLSTVYIDASSADSGVAAGIVGTTSGVVELANCVFASDVKAATSGNITSDGAERITCYYDKQLSSVEDSSAAALTHYLTSGADMDQLGFGDSMTRLNDGSFMGYPVPVAFANTDAANGFVPTENFLAGVKLASARINLASGAGVGSITTFTNITAPADLSGYNAQLTYGSYEPVDNYYLVKPAGTATQIDTDTAQLPLGVKADRYVMYRLSDGGFDGSKMLRYLDLDVGKTLKVTYQYNGLESGANAVLTAFSGMNNISGVTAFAVSGKHSGNLCSSIVIPMDSAEDAYILRVGSELPTGKSIASVSAEVRNNGSKVLDATPTEMDNGIWKLAMTPESNIDCDEIVIIINVKETPVWGIRKLFNLF
ncbi:MAG: hypothetical protein IJA87_04570 [Clostridia bacterium]|nr:hypothetical protein [Clostridia bacterium]